MNEWMNEWMNKKWLAPLRWSLLESVFWEHKETVFQRQTRLYLMLQLYLVMCKSHPAGTGFEGMKGSWRAAEARHYERPRMAAWDWMGHAKDLRLGTMKKAYGRLLGKPSFIRRSHHIEDVSTMGWPARTAAAVEMDQAELRVLQRTELQKWHQLFGGVHIMCGSEILKHEAVTLKLPWRPDDVRDARAMGYLQGKAANRE